MTLVLQRRPCRLISTMVDCFFQPQHHQSISTTALARRISSNASISSSATWTFDQWQQQQAESVEEGGNSNNNNKPNRWNLLSRPPEPINHFNGCCLAGGVVAYRLAILAGKLSWFYFQLNPIVDPPVIQTPARTLGRHLAFANTLIGLRIPCSGELNKFFSSKQRCQPMSTASSNYNNVASLLRPISATPIGSPCIDRVFTIGSKRGKGLIFNLMLCLPMFWEGIWTL